MTPPLRVERVVAREIRLPLRRPFEIASGVTDERRVLLLELVHPDGPRVWSECVAGEVPDYSEETVDTARVALRRWLAPRLEGRELSGPRVAFPVLSRGVRGHRMAMASLEMGVWAMQAVLEGRPLVELLGGRCDRIPTGVTLSLAAPRETLAVEAREAAGAGYRRVKVKIAPGRDGERLRAVREAVGPDVDVAADANGSYDRDRPAELPRVDELGLTVLEQPFAPPDLVGHRTLRRRLRATVALDESVTSPGRAGEMVSLGSAGALNLKPGRVGGFAPSMAIHDLCREAGIPLWCGGMLETGLGRAYNAALASLPGFELPSDIYPPGRYLAEDIVKPRWRTSPDGTVKVPRRRAGAGVEVDRDRVEDSTVWEEAL